MLNQFFSYSYPTPFAEPKGNLMHAWLRPQTRFSPLESWIEDVSALFQRLICLCDTEDSLLARSNSNRGLHTILFDLNVLVERGQKLLVASRSAEAAAALLTPLQVARKLVGNLDGTSKADRQQVRDELEDVLRVFGTLARLTPA